MDTRVCWCLNVCVCRPDLNQGYRGGSAGPLRCGKASTWEGGMRAPAIAWWPGRVRHARTHQVCSCCITNLHAYTSPSLPPSLPPSLQLASSLDLLPTIFTLAGAKLPQDRRIDGVDMSDILFDQYGQVRNTRQVLCFLFLVCYYACRAKESSLPTSLKMQQSRLGRLPSGGVSTRLTTTPEGSLAPHTILVHQHHSNTVGQPLMITQTRCAVGTRR